ncbi:ATP-binding protein [Streptomyces sp. NPDC059639]|uniref:ATP-binding protein n=1 Tax=Streptomyces sp. NPDC059639 TaxID=3346891 RepID=UPI0036C4D6B2
MGVPPAGASEVYREWVMAYEPSEASVPRMRLHVRRRLALWQWPGDIQDAALVASELSTNALRHGYVPGCLLETRLALLAGGGLFIDVSDAVEAFPRFGEAIQAGPDDESGRGLLMVCRLGGEIGWFPTRDGKTVRVLLRPASDGDRGR